MLAADLIAQLTTLTTTDPQACNGAELAQSMAAVHAIRGFLDAFETGVIRRTAELGEPAAVLLRDGGRRPVREAEAAVARGADMPEMHSALMDGRMSAGHVDAVARVAARPDDSVRAELVGMAPVVIASAAAASSTETFERQIRDLGRRLSRDNGVSEHDRLRTALRAMYRTCGHPDCEVRFADCDIHHVIPWGRAGPTANGALIPLSA